MNIICQNYIEHTQYPWLKSLKLPKTSCFIGHLVKEFDLIKVRGWVIWSWNLLCTIQVFINKVMFDDRYHTTLFSYFACPK